MKSTRPNASTGPRSAAGKARSSMNALKSGIYSKSLVIPGEDRAQLDTLLDEYLQRFQPAVPEQRDLVDILVRSTWTLRRLAAAETQVWTYTMERPITLNRDAPLGHAFSGCDDTLSRLQRMVNSTQRNYRDALRELERLQAVPLNPEPEPVSAPAPAPQPAETAPVTPIRQFVSSPSPQSPKKPLPYHLPGSDCHLSPRENSEYTQLPQCPRCFPEQRGTPR